MREVIQKNNYGVSGDGMSISGVRWGWRRIFKKTPRKGKKKETMGVGFKRVRKTMGGLDKRGPRGNNRGKGEN